MSSFKVILASGSPRRTELLSSAGVPHQIVVPKIEERLLKRETPLNMVKRLSKEKAIAVAESRIHTLPNAWVIAADTTVVNSVGKVLEKPKTRLEAKKMLKSLQGKTHRVLTGFTLIKVQGGVMKSKTTQVTQTQVKIRPLSDDELEQYLDRGESMDKAGAYAAQGYGMALVESIRGSYTSVVGLPIAEVLKGLKKLGYMPSR